jgi:hypothetical protein
MKGQTMAELHDTFEELGKGKLASADVSVAYTWDHGEEQTWDYPGSPAHAEDIDIQLDCVESFGLRGDDGWRLERNGPRSDWFDYAECCVKAGWEDCIEYWRTINDRILGR